MQNSRLKLETSTSSAVFGFGGADYLELTSFASGKIGKIIYINSTGDEVLNTGTTGKKKRSLFSLIGDAIFGQNRSSYLTISHDKNDQNANAERARMAKELHNEGVH